MSIFEYFQYVMDSLDLEKPTHWREALKLYYKLVQYQCQVHD